MNDDWSALCAIYGEDDAFAESSRLVRVTATGLPFKKKNGGDGVRVGSDFCGTVHMTLSTVKVIFARRVDDAGHYRYFTLQRPPSLKLDFLYTGRSTGDDGDDHEEYSCDDDGPSSLRLTWNYYPVEWPKVDEEPYRKSLAKKCHSILQDERMSFAVCEFLEHHALSHYRRSCSSDFDDGWKSYVDDDNHPDFQLIILPPEMDRMYQPTIGTLIHPQQEALKKERRDRKQNAVNKKETSAKDVTKDDMDAVDFGSILLIRFWKELYTTTCPICLDDSVLFSEGVVLPYCQHYSCRDCFQMYLKHKVQDLKDYRTNPFVCPVVSCRRELPIIGYCKQHLSDEDMEAVRRWYRDLKNPPCWSLDRCLYSKTCGAIGSIRRRESSITTKERKSSYESYLVYCEECNSSWCELCLKRVYDNNDGKARNDVQTPFNHHCQPEAVLKLCRRYTAASKESQAKCEERYPWIQSYSQFCQHDGEAQALQYVIDNAARCPCCGMGIQRVEGCFHMKCSVCATHFCYECSTELFPPFYGTHHCWEEGLNDNNRTIQERLLTDTDEQFALALYLEQAI